MAAQQQQGRAGKGLHRRYVPVVNDQVIPARFSPTRKAVRINWEAGRRIPR